MEAFYRNSIYGEQYQYHSQKLFQVISKTHNNQYLMSILIEHKKLIEKLLENQNFLTAAFQNLMRSQTTDTQHNWQDSAPILPQHDFLLNKNKQKTVNTILIPCYAEVIQSDQTQPKKKIEIFSKFLQDQELKYWTLQNNNNKEDQIPNEKKAKRCETKNLVKNFGKSILTFIRKNKDLRNKLLQSFKISQFQFSQQFRRFSNNLNTLSDLKIFWTEEGNHCAKIFRALSNIYLRKYSLEHTFSSRVRNINVHIKYRKRLLQILKNPDGFSSMKTF